MRFLKQPRVMFTIDSEDCPHDVWTCNRCGSMVTLKEMTPEERKIAVENAMKIIKEARALRDLIED